MALNGQFYFVNINYDTRCGLSVLFACVGFRSVFWHCQRGWQIFLYLLSNAVWKHSLIFKASCEFLSKYFSAAFLIYIFRTWFSARVTDGQRNVVPGEEQRYSQRCFTRKKKAESAVTKKLSSKSAKSDLVSLIYAAASLSEDRGSDRRPTAVA